MVIITILSSNFSAQMVWQRKGKNPRLTDNMTISVRERTKVSQLMVKNRTISNIGGASQRTIWRKRKQKLYHVAIFVKILRI